MTAEQVAARALADGFLAGGWDLTGLVDRGARVLGARRRWLPALARAVIGAYRDPPTDRPRELAGFVARSLPFERAARDARRRGTVIRVRVLLPAPVRMRPSRFPVPHLDDLADLARFLDLDPARLDWLADVRGMQRRAPHGPLHPYRYRWVQRSGRPPRLLETPLPRLRAVQRRLLREVAGLIPAHPAAHGFVPGRSAATGATVHAGTGGVLCLDLATFFATVRAGQVYGAWRVAGYPEPVAHVLTGLCLHATPRSVLAAMPAGGDPSDRFRLRRALASGHLPQGAPTSPHLANLACFRLDGRLAGYAAALDLNYSRYADDLAFSGDGLPGRAHRLVAAVSRIGAEEGFRLNPGKTRLRTRADRQQVTGLVVNERVSVTRAEYDTLRAILHNCARTGPAGQNRAGHRDFRAHLLGRVAWVNGVDPRRGARLREAFDRIAW